MLVTASSGGFWKRNLVINLDLNYGELSEICRVIPFLFNFDPNFWTPEGKQLFSLISRLHYGRREIRIDDRANHYHADSTEALTSQRRT
jgi:hypothetical protein